MVPVSERWIGARSNCRFGISVFWSGNKHLMHQMVSRHVWWSNQGAMQRNTVHTREDPEQDMNSNYCSGIFRLQTSSVAGGGGGVEASLCRSSAVWQHQRSVYDRATFKCLVLGGWLLLARVRIGPGSNPIQDYSYGTFQNHSVGHKGCKELKRNNKTM